MRKIFRSVLHGLLWAYALRQVSCLEIWQQTSLPRRWISNMEWQDYHRLESNSSPSNRPESTPKMVVSRTEIYATPSVRLKMRSIIFTGVRGFVIRRNLYTFGRNRILARIWAWFDHSMPIFIAKQVKVSRRPCRRWRVTSDGRADRFAIFHPKSVLLPLFRLRGLS